MDDRTALDARTYTEAEIAAMDTDTLMRVYKETGNEELRWPLVLRYEHLVKTVALQVKSVYSGFAQVEDIISEGILTLLGALDKYEPEKGVKFETYVAKRLRGMIIDLARQQDWLPRTVRRRMKEIDTAASALSNELGRYPTDAEIADSLNITQERYRKDLAEIALGNVLSLDALIHMYDTEGQILDLLPADTDSLPESVLQRHELQSVLEAGIASLRKNEQIVLSLHYERNLQLNEIAQVMGLTPPRISQIHAKAIEKLRSYLEPYLSGSQTARANS